MNIVSELIFRSRCRDSCSLQVRGKQEKNAPVEACLRLPTRFICYFLLKLWIWRAGALKWAPVKGVGERLLTGPGPLSVPWSLRPQNRAAAATAAVVAASIAAATETCGEFFFVGCVIGTQEVPLDNATVCRVTLKKLEENFIPIGCSEHGAQFPISGLKALAPWLKNRTRLASFWRFFCGRGPKAACLRRDPCLVA